ncbi:7622_t:CDS:2 [Funneliformis caledonium]|uniref:7622_t:CDS:1 n=1 Tax=Funneliformis caledonium TaxID=1117310 RepID=A0A9N9DWB6_9GLOM|nr:7622_t:CDS:2 [Funneliformis caledonium]
MTLANGTLRPFFAILLRKVLNLNVEKLCLILSGTGMSFNDIKIHAASAIAKSGGSTFKNFFSIHDGFYKCIQLLEHALSNTSSISQSNVNEKERSMEQIADIMIRSMLSHYTKLVKGDEGAEMVQYGFSQLCSFEHLEDLNALQMDAISIQIAELIPILVIREYIKKHPDEFEAQHCEIYVQFIIMHHVQRKSRSVLSESFGRGLKSRCMKQVGRMNVNGKIYWGIELTLEGDGLEEHEAVL